MQWDSDFISSLAGPDDSGDINDTLQTLKEELRKRMDDIFSDWADAPGGVGYQLHMNEGFIHKEHVNADIAGTGLEQEADGSLSIDTDDTSLVCSSNGLTLVDRGVVHAKRDYVLPDWDLANYNNFGDTYYVGENDGGGVATAITRYTGSSRSGPLEIYSVGAWRMSYKSWPGGLVASCGRKLRLIPKSTAFTDVYYPVAGQFRE